MNTWIKHYPRNHRKHLIQRIRTSNDLKFRSSFFELYLNELLLKLGYEVEVHPEIKSKRIHPDFLVKSDGDSLFYLEAKTTKGSHEDTAAEKRVNIVYDSLDKLYSPNFFIGVQVRGSPNSSPPGKKWRIYLEKELRELDPDILGGILKNEGLEALPNWTRKHDGWEVEFKPIPKSPKARGEKDLRPLGFRMTGFQLVKDNETISKAVNEKATKYGNLGIPYIIAINILSDFCDDLAVMDGLFGQEGFSAFMTEKGEPIEKRARKPNGAWRGKQGWQNTRASAVLINKNLRAGNVARVNPVLWHHPFAKYPLDISRFPISQRKLNNQTKKMELIEGKSMWHLLGLYENWPL